jgi:pyrophosphate--fructose-6-phosphate 1-phosphotransferase
MRKKRALQEQEKDPPEVFRTTIFEFPQNSPVSNLASCAAQRTIALAMIKRPKKVALLTAGGLAPCLNAAVAGLIRRYTEIDPSIEIIAYRSGYKGLLLGDSYKVDADVRENIDVLFSFGGSAIGNSRVKLTNVADCVKRGLVKEGEDPQKKAADQLVGDGVDVLHTIGGDDTNTAAADLAKFLARNNYDLTVIGLPKTVDNDVIPIRQSLGAWTAAEEGARFFENVVNEFNANPRMLIVHEVMGRHCGWLTAATARAYRDLIDHDEYLPELGLSMENLDVHAVYVPEMEIDLDAEADRLKVIMDEIDNVNIFVSEGAGVDAIVAKMEAAGETVPRDAFGHVKLDAVNPGAYFAKQFAARLGAEKVLVQKSGYFGRAAAANADDLRLIQSCVDTAVDCALRREGGVIGHDEEQGGVLRAIEFERIKGGKPFDIDVDWFVDLLDSIDQPKGKKIAAH